MKLSVVIPCYNEEKNIPHLLSRLQTVLGERQDVEIILVDNGSTDQSPDVFAKALAQQNDPRLKTVRIPVNQGYGYGITQGLEAATGDVLAWTHADLQTDAADALRAFDLWQKNPAPNLIVKGKRLNRRWLESFFTYGMQVFARLMLGVKLDDINAQPKLFARPFYEQHLRAEAPTDFSLDLFLLYKASKLGCTVQTVPVVFANRLYGEAKGGGSWKTRIKLIRRTLSYIVDLKKRLQ